MQRTFEHLSPFGNGDAAATTARILGVKTYAGTISDAARAVVARAAGREGGYVCLCGAHLLTMAYRHPEVRAALDGACMNFPDGAPVAWRQRAAGLAHATRIGGPDLMPAVVEAGAADGLRHVLLGSTEPVLESLKARLVERAPGALVVGEISPPYRREAGFEPAVLERIVDADPHVVWVGLGAPKQELWMMHHAPRLPSTLLVGVGAAFDFISGNKQRAPEWMRNRGLEWLHRMASEPRRLGPRYLDTNTRFIAYNLKEFVADRRHARRPSEPIT